MTRNKVISSLATCGNLGYCTFPGTRATLITLIGTIILRIHNFFNNYTSNFIGMIVVTIAAFFIINQAQKYFVKKDPQQIVLDEIVAALWIFLFIPLTFSYFLCAFIFFRFFDGTKYCIAWTEKFKGAWGIMIDDLVAALVTHLLLCLLTFITLL